MLLFYYPYYVVSYRFFKKKNVNFFPHYVCCFHSSSIPSEASLHFKKRKENEKSLTVALQVTGKKNTPSLFADF